MKKYLLLITFLCAAFTSLTAQKFRDTAINKHKYGISLKVNTILAGGVNFDAFLSPRVNAEISASAFLSMGGEAGLNYHFFEKPLDLRIGDWSPYMGIHAGYYELHFLTQTDYLLFYVPVGVQYLSEHHISIALDAGYSLQRISDYRQGGIEPYKTESLHLPHLRIKVGYRF